MLYSSNAKSKLIKQRKPRQNKHLKKKLNLFLYNTRILLLALAYDFFFKQKIDPLHNWCNS